MIKKIILVIACIFAANHIPCYGMDTSETILYDPIFRNFFCHHPHSTNKTSEQESYFYTQPKVFLNPSLHAPRPTYPLSRLEYPLAAIIDKIEEQISRKKLQKIPESNQQAITQGQNPPHIAPQKAQKKRIPQQIATYRQAKTLKCPLCQPNKITFSWYNDLFTHLQTHIKRVGPREKQYFICKECNCSCTTLFSCKEHILRQSKQNIFFCNRCRGKGFRTKSDMQRHMCLHKKKAITFARKK